MDLRKAINKLLLEDNKHNFGCVMLFFDFPQIKEIHSQIDENDLYIDEEDPSFGLETDPHVTLLYGLHDNVTTDDVKNIISQKEQPIRFVGYNISIFDSPKYDVLKLDVGNLRKGRHPYLFKNNKSLSSLPHEESPHDYHPHMTIAYIKQGMGQKYIEKFNGTQFDLKPSYVGYSKTDGSLDKIEI